MKPQTFDDRVFNKRQEFGKGNDLLFDWFIGQFMALSFQKGIFAHDILRYVSGGEVQTRHKETHLIATAYYMAMGKEQARDFVSNAFCYMFWRERKGENKPTWYNGTVHPKLKI